MIQKNAKRTFGVSAKPGPYGLKIPDYSQPPPKWPLPPPPPMSRTQKLLAPLMIGLFAAGLIFIYFNQEEDIYEYWQQVEQGNVPLGDDDEDDDDDE